MCQPPRRRWGWAIGPLRQNVATVVSRASKVSHSTFKRAFETWGKPVAETLVKLRPAESFGSVDESRFRPARTTDYCGSPHIKTILPSNIPMARTKRRSRPGTSMW